MFSARTARQCGHARGAALLASVLVSIITAGCAARGLVPIDLTPQFVKGELRADAVRSTGSGFGMVVAYRLQAEGFRGDGYRLELGYADGAQKVVLEQATVNDRGMVVTGGDDGAQPVEVELALRGMAPGEPLRIAIATEDGMQLASALAVPRPIEAGKEDGCRLVAQLERKPVLGYRVHLAGFAASEPVTVSLSGMQEREQTSSPIGALSELGVFLPLSKLLEDPRAVTLAASAPSCRASVELDWSDVPQVSQAAAPESTTPSWQQPWPRKIPRTPLSWQQPWPRKLPPIQLGWQQPWPRKLPPIQLGWQQPWPRKLPRLPEHS